MKAKKMKVEARQVFDRVDETVIALQSLIDRLESESLTTNPEEENGAVREQRDGGFDEIS